MQVDQRRDEVFFSPCNTQDETLPVEFMKGEGSGIYLALNFLKLLIEALEDELKGRKTEISKEDA